MKKASIRNVVIVSVLTAAFVLTGGAANAYGTYMNFNVILPVGSLPGWAGDNNSDVKSVSYTNGDLHITSVGSTYKVRGQMTNIAGLDGTTQTAELSDSSYSPLPNHFKVTTLVKTQLRISTFNSVTVQVIGKWRAN